MDFQNVLTWKVAPSRVAVPSRRLRPAVLFSIDDAHLGQSSARHSFRILCDRVDLAYLSPVLKESHVLLECNDCQIAYGIRLDDPHQMFSRVEWNRRISAISSVILHEHSAGHPSLTFVHDGMLKAQIHRKSPLERVRANGSRSAQAPNSAHA